MFYKFIPERRARILEKPDERRYAVFFSSPARSLFVHRSVLTASRALAGWARSSFSSFIIILIRENPTNALLCGWTASRHHDWWMLHASCKRNKPRRGTTIIHDITRFSSSSKLAEDSSRMDFLRLTLSASKIECGSFGRDFAESKGCMCTRFAFHPPFLYVRHCGRAAQGLKVETWNRGFHFWSWDSWQLTTCLGPLFYPIFLGYLVLKSRS